MTPAPTVTGYGRNRRWLRPIARRLRTRHVRRLPRRLAVPLLDASSSGRGAVRDVRSIDVPAPFRLDVYWLLRGEEGPAASLFVRGEEMMRLDCLPSRPHVHYALTEARYGNGLETRVFLPPGGVDASIDRAVFEVARNVPYNIGLDRRRRVRAIEIDLAAFGEAAARMGGHMRDLVARHDTGRDA